MTRGTASAESKFLSLIMSAKKEEVVMFLLTRVSLFFTTCLLIIMMAGCTLDTSGTGEPGYEVPVTGNLWRHSFDGEKHYYSIYGYIANIGYEAEGIYDVKKEEGLEIVYLTGYDGSERKTVAIQSIVECPVDPWLYPNVWVSSYPRWTSENMQDATFFVSKALQVGYAMEELFPVSRHYFKYMSDSELSELRNKAEIKDKVGKLDLNIDNCPSEIFNRPPEIFAPSNYQILDYTKPNAIDHVLLWLKMPCGFSKGRGALFDVRLQKKEHIVLNGVVVPNRFAWENFPSQDNNGFPVQMKHVGHIANGYSQGIHYLSRPLPFEDGLYRFKVRNVVQSPAYVMGDWSDDWRYFFWGPVDVDISAVSDFLLSVDLKLSQYEGITVFPGEQALDGQVVSQTSYSFKWNVNNIGKETSPKTTLRIQCNAMGEAPCPWDGPYKDFEIKAIDPETDMGDSVAVTIPVPASIGKAVYGFLAHVNPDNKIIESQANNSMVSYFAGKNIKVDAGKFLESRVPDLQ